MHSSLCAQEPAKVANAEENPAVEFQHGRVREIKVTVEDEKDTPVAGVTVNLYGIQRGERMPLRQEDKETIGKSDDDETPATKAWWQFVSDKEGSFVVRFPINQEPGKTQGPYEGPFYLVAKMPDGRRAVSAPILHQQQQPYDSTKADKNEWNAVWGREPLSTENTPYLTLTLKTGNTVSGIVTNMEGKPLQGKTVTAIHDLHANTHTGYGGTIFVEKSTTDSKGRFRLNHVYPVACELSVDGSWVRTQIAVKSQSSITSRWLDRELEVLPHLGDNLEIVLTMQLASKDPVHRYHGTVQDHLGKPVQGLRITAGISRHKTPQTWGDNHHFEHAISGNDGRWELKASSPFVRFLSVGTNDTSTEELAGGDYENDELGLAAPGEYDFTLKKP